MKKFVCIVSIILNVVLVAVGIFFIYRDSDEVKTEALPELSIDIGTISGQIMIKDNGPMSGGGVSFYDELSGPPPSATEYWRAPTMRPFILDKDGRFSANIPVGKYYLSAGRDREKTGNPTGPPQHGDFFLISQDKNGNPKLHTVKKGKQVDLGILEAAPFSRAALAEEKVVTAVEGIVSGEDGKPVAGLLVYAYVASEKPDFAGWPPRRVGPVFVSDRTGQDGEYRLRVSAGGSYNLKVREKYGRGPFREGELINIGDREPPTIINVQTGEIINGINIIVHKSDGSRM